MVYVPYKSLTESEYVNLKNEFNIFEKSVNEYMTLFEFEKSKDEKTEYLAANFNKVNEKNYFGNIAIIFDDLPQLESFSLHVMKAYDVEKGRYYYRDTIIKNKLLSDFYIHFKEWVKEAVDKYNSLTFEDLKEFVEFTSDE